MYNGKYTKIDMMRKRPCTTCHGKGSTGSFEGKACYHCNSSGKVTAKWNDVRCIYQKL